MARNSTLATPHGGVKVTRLHKGRAEIRRCVRKRGVCVHRLQVQPLRHHCHAARPSDTTTFGSTGTSTSASASASTRASARARTILCTQAPASLLGHGSKQGSQVEEGEHKPRVERQGFLVLCRSSC